MNDGLTPLLRLLSCLGNNRPVPPDLRGWFCEGAVRALTGRQPSLEHALGISWQGAHPIQVRFARRLRNYLLRRAMLIAGGPTQLARAVQRFELRKWPRWHRLEWPPEHAQDIEKVLFAAFKVSRGIVPDNRRSLARICGPMPPGSDAASKAIPSQSSETEKLDAVMLSRVKRDLYHQTCNEFLANGWADNRSDFDRMAREYMGAALELVDNPDDEDINLAFIVFGARARLEAIKPIIADNHRKRHDKPTTPLGAADPIHGEIDEILKLAEIWH